MRWLYSKLCWLACALIAGSAMAGAPRYHSLGDNVQLSCTQTVPESLVCDYRLLTHSRVLEVAARIHNTPLPAPALSTSGSAFGNHTILFLVDTSNPSRQPLMASVRQHIHSLMAGADERHSFGLAAFDTETRVLAAPGASAEEVRALTPNVQAIGQTAELYRSVLRAVRLLSTHPAERRTLILMGGGAGEDQAYFHEDVIEAASAGGVTIVGMGYMISPDKSANLQSLRRLTEEAGGIYFAAGEHPELPESFVSDLYQTLGQGGGFTFDLRPAIAAGLNGPRMAYVHFTLDEGFASASIRVKLPAHTRSETVVIEQPVLVENTTPTMVEQAVSQTTETTTAIGEPSTLAKITVDNQVLWYAVGGLTVLVLAMLCLLVALLRRKRTEGREKLRPPPVVSADLAIGILQPHDESESPLTITSNVFRIGRHSSNDLAVADPSVSRQHAEIHKRSDGTFSIIDLNSMNGVFVNDKQLRHSDLSDGDLVELGDVAFTFSVQVAPEESIDQTIMLTAVPDLEDAQGSEEEPSDDEGDGEEKIA